MRKFAESLIALETTGRKSPASQLPVAFHVCNKLGPELATFMGRTGFRALLTRALALARHEAPWLGEVRINEDGTFEGLGQLEMKADSGEIAEGGLAVLAQLLGLLVAFIGENLTLRMMGNVWPKLALTDLNFGEKK